MADRVALSDPTLPIDPESATRALGAALSARHSGAAGAVAGEGAVLRLDDLAEHLVAAAQGHGGSVSSGPLAGRGIEELAGIAHAAVRGLPPGRRLVPIRPGLTLDDCLISARGEVDVVGATVRGDAHLDLAAAAVGVADRFGSAVVAPLFDAYGMDAVDLLALDSCQQLVAVAAEVGWPEPAGG